MSRTCSWESGYINFLSDHFTSALLHESKHSGGDTLDSVLGNDFKCFRFSHLTKTLLSMITALFQNSLSDEAVIAPSPPPQPLLSTLLNR